MIAAAPPPAHTAAAAVRTLRGRTSQGAPMRIAVRGSRIVAIHLTLLRYVCDPEGDIAPLAVDRMLDVDPGADRVFGLTLGPPSERLRIDGRRSADGRQLRGSLRVRGTIGTGDPCRSSRITFALG